MAEAKDSWVGVALDAQIQPNSSNPAIVEGHEIAIWRDQDGPARVWRDRCPHRGMRLSYGFVRDGALRCIYHGWAYEGGGKCVSVPAHPDLVPPKSICVETFGAETRHGIVWANLSETREAELPDLGGGENWLPVKSVFLDLDAAQTMEGVRAFDAGALADLQERAPGVHTVTSGNGATLLFAVQPAGDGKTVLHIALEPGAEDTKPFQIRMVKRMERLRRALAAR